LCGENNSVQLTCINVRALAPAQLDRTHVFDKGAWIMPVDDC